MAVKWTRDQQQVIESRGCNLLVSAAAGSGKTAVLVERIIRRITEGENPLDIDRLLVMTFTRAAASEMRERIQAAIEKRLEENPQDEHLQQQAVLVQYAPITTIDSFCLQILREHFDCLDIDPAFRVADEGELLLMRGDVMEELLEDYYRDGGERYEKFVDAYASGKADAGISDYVLQVYTFAQSNPWPGEWLESCRLELQETEAGDLEKTEWMRFLLSDAARQAQDWIRELQEAAKICREEGGPEPYLPMIQADLRFAEELLESTVSYGDFCRALERVSFGRLASIRQKDAVDPEKKEQVSGGRSRVKKGVERMKEDYLFASPREILEDMQAGREGILVLLELAEEFGRRFREKKREKNIVDFHDLEHFALEILTEGPEHSPGPVADELSRQFDEILVDEYQDSNLVQETLVQCVCSQRFGRPNVFMVGDVKQSIYKFRLARPELFLEKYRTYTKEEGPCRKIELHQNFRSRDHVLESVNACFRRIMTEKLGDIAYTEDAALHPGAEFAPRQGLLELESELLLIDTSQEGLEALDEDTADYTSRELEARMIAAKIREMTAEQTGISVWDKEENRYRRARFGDIVILLRSVSGWAEEFVEVLTGQGIPAFAESRTGYFDTVEVETILNLLAVIDNPLQDIPLAAVLRSPFGGLTDEELARIAAARAGKLDGSREPGLYAAVEAFLEQEGESSEGAESGKETDAGRRFAAGGISAPGATAAGESAADERLVPGATAAGAASDLPCRLRRILGLIEAFRREAVYLPLHQLLYDIYDRTGYYRYVAAMPGGETRRANLDMLVEKAAAYEETSYRGVFHFIRYIEKLKKYNTDFGEAAADGGGNGVRIISIHKSKGLEFPVVFVSGLGKSFNKQDTRGKLLIDAQLGVGTDYLDSERRLKGPTLKKNVMKRRMELEALGEELRVLYVAMTRAKEKLILTGSSRKLEERMEKWNAFPLEEGRVPFTVLTAASSCLDWILMSLRENRDSFHVKIETPKRQLGREVGLQARRGLARRELLELAAESSGVAGEMEAGGEPVGEESGESLSRRLARAYAFVYPFRDDMVLNTKMSVSELKRMEPEPEEETALLPTLPVFMERTAGPLGGALRGTAYHRALELFPFGELAGRWPDLPEEAAVITAAEVRQRLEDFRAAGKMAEEERKLVDSEELAGFLNSPLGRRMAAAAARGSLYREQQFVIGIPAREMGDWDSDERILIQGIIDAFFEEEGKLILVDYKTDRVDSPGTLLERYRAQLDYYGRALEQITEKEVSARYLYSFRFGAIRV